MKQIDTHDLNLISGWLQAYADGESLRSQGEHQQIMATLEAIKVLPDAQPAIEPGARVAVDKPPFDPLVDNWVPYEEDFRTGTVTMRVTQESIDHSSVIRNAVDFVKAHAAEPAGDDMKVLWPGPSSNYWVQMQAEMMRLRKSLFADLYMMQPILEPHPDGTLLLIPAITPAEARKQLYGNSFSSHTIDDIWDEQKPKRKPL